MGDIWIYDPVWAGHAMLQMADGKQNNQDICQGSVKDAHFDDKF